MKQSPSTKKILFLTPQPFFASRGSPFRVRETVTALTKLGYEVDLLAYPFGDDIDVPGVTIRRGFRIPGVRSIPIGPSYRKIAFDALLACSATILVLRNRYISYHGIEEAAFIAGVLAFLRRKPFIYDMHSHMSNQLETGGHLRSRGLLKLFRALEHYFMRRAAGVITVGEDLTGYVRNIARNQIVRTLHDCAPNDEVSDEVSIVPRIDEKVFLYAGNLSPYQGIDLLLTAFAAARKRGAKARLLIAGGGPEGEQLLEGYRARAAALGIAEGTEFLGQLTPGEVAAILPQADVLVSPRITGNNPPMKIYTYMSSRCAIVATTIRSHTQVLDESCAYMAEPVPEEFAEALLRSIDDSPSAREERERKITRAAERVQERYSREAFQRILSEVYQGLGPEAPALERAPAEALKRAS